MRCENGDVRCENGDVRCENGELKAIMRQPAFRFSAFLLFAFRFSVFASGENDYDFTFHLFGGKMVVDFA